jgi:hypothetical protein
VVTDTGSFVLELDPVITFESKDSKDVATDISKNGNEYLSVEHACLPDVLFVQLASSEMVFIYFQGKYCKGTITENGSYNSDLYSGCTQFESRSRHRLS